ncbi:hypothetical protein OG625_20610 [Streptomyces sp. NBC_01351]|uniref:AfsR/SARP family transcriptional regulator n=1 Tax=Streptomyces sp. NBC_01351 TaxID=2903833 RepID=UPI002E360A7F|nr:BTAD domain-containing putative transcriptional regulator [Streptomyces sp. NBC_01351]
MDIDVLGGLDVLENGVPIAPATPSERQVLAVLAVHADQVVPVAVLAGELEACAPPEQVHAVLEGCLQQLRERLAAAVAPGGRRTARTVLARAPGGYLLDTGGGRHDLREFEREAAAGRRAMARGEYANAAGLLRGALRLWKGPVLDGVTPGPRLAERVAELEALRKEAVEQWVDAGLALDGQREQGFPDSDGPPDDGLPDGSLSDDALLDDELPEDELPEGGLTQAPTPPGFRSLPRQFTPIGSGDTGRYRMRIVRIAPAPTATPAAPDRRGAGSANRQVRRTPTR